VLAPVSLPFSFIQSTEQPMKSLILWIAGVPLTVIIALKIFGVF